MTNDCVVFKFLQPSVVWTEKLWWVFRVKPLFSSSVAWTGLNSYPCNDFLPSSRLEIFRWIYIRRFDRVLMCLRATRRHQTFRWSFEITFKKVSITKGLYTNRNRNQIKWEGLSIRYFCSIFVFTGTGENHFSNYLFHSIPMLLDETRGRFGGKWGTFSCRQVIHTHPF